LYDTEISMRRLTAVTIAALALRAAPVSAGEVAAAADIAGGWMSIGSSGAGGSSTLSGPVIDVAASAGGAVGRGGVGGVVGLLGGPTLDETWSGGGRRDRLLMPHAGAYATLRFPHPTVSATARLELAYAWIRGPMFNLADGPSTTGTIASGLGGLASVAMSYDLTLGRDQRLAVGLDLTGGWLGLKYTGSQLTPLAVLAFIGVRWD
jgi:hypothetical protein